MTNGHSNSSRSLRVVLTSALLVLVMCEMGARLLSVALPPPAGWNDRQLGRQVSRMSMVASEHETCVAFVGSSATAASISPGVLTPALERDDWYVAWAAGATMRLLEPWTSEVVLQVLHPRFVVIGLTSYELNDAFTGRDDLVDSYLHSPDRRRLTGQLTLRDRVTEALGNASALVRYRPYLRSPAELVARLTGRLAAMSPPYGVDDATDRIEQATPVGFYVERYAVGGARQEALGHLLVSLKRQGVVPVLVDLPVLEEKWTPLHQHGQRDLDAHRAALRDIARTQEVPLLAYPGEFQEPDLFLDPIHLNLDGARLFSRQLGLDLRRLIESRSGVASCSPARPQTAHDSTRSDSLAQP